MSSVDVIIPCYRYGHFLRECVASALSQAGVDVRVVVIDDASPDQTAEVGAALAAEDSRVTFVRHGANKGHIATYNEGIDWVSSTYMLLLSADDYLLPGALMRAVRFLDRHAEAGFVFGRAMRLSVDGRQTPTEKVIRGSRTEELLSGQQFIERSGCSNIVPTPTAVVRTALQKEVGGYRAELPHSGDMEMWFRLAARGSVGILETAQAVYRVHTSNMSHAYNARGRLPDLVQRKAAFDTFIETGGHALADADRIREQATHLFSRHAVNLASGAFNDGDVAVSRQLSDYAVSLSPSVVRTLPWLKLSFKRTLGPQAWMRLRSVAQRLSGGERPSGGLRSE